MLPTWPTEPPSLRLRSLETRHHAIPDQVALELGDGRRFRSFRAPLTVCTIRAEALDDGCQASRRASKNPRSAGVRQDMAHGDISGSRVRCLEITSFRDAYPLALA